MGPRTCSSSAHQLSQVEQRSGTPSGSFPPQAVAHTITRDDAPTNSWPCPEAEGGPKVGRVFGAGTDGREVQRLQDNMKPKVRHSTRLSRTRRLVRWLLSGIVRRPQSGHHPRQSEGVCAGGGGAFPCTKTPFGSEILRNETRKPEKKAYLSVVREYVLSIRYDSISSTAVSIIIIYI